MIFDKEDFKAYDADLWNAIAKEEERQQNNIELIASENVVSKAVMAAQGSILTNKYAEVYPEIFADGPIKGPNSRINSRVKG